MNFRRYAGLIVLIPSMMARAYGAEWTALALVKEGDKVVAAPARDKIAEIHSEKSDGSLSPNVWHIGYFDTTAPFKRTELKFVDGKVESVERPVRILDSFHGSKPLDWKKVKIDSDRALAIALKTPAMKGAHPSSAQFSLNRTPTGSIWRIHFWAAKVGTPDQTVDLGEIQISGKTGEVLKTDLRL